MMSNIAIKVSHLTKIYKLYDKPSDRLKESLHPLKKKYHNEFYALKDVSFEIKKGETVGIIGKNGAGKSTLLKIITGVLTPTSGHVHVNGRIASLLELGAGFNPEYTGLENIYFQGTLMGYNRIETESKVGAILQFADIGDFVHQPVKTYSSGMFARLAFAIAINVEPDILIVDEALAVGDMNFQAKCMTAMDRIKQGGTTILFVSHDISSVRSLCSRGIYIKNGALFAIGEGSEIADIYMREARAEMNKNHVAKIYSERMNNRTSFSESSPQSSLTNGEKFIRSEEFNKRVAQHREGTGEARITFVEILDTSNTPIIEAEFNQEIKIKIYLESYTDNKISVNFHILDDKAINIVTCSFLLAGAKLVEVKKGDRLIVEYTLKLPLQHNTYSLNTMITSPIINDVDIRYIDVVHNSYIFKVNKRPGSILWSKVDLFPKLSIIKYD